MANERSVVVTGASRGIGQACALRLARRGFRVFAGVLPGEDASGLLRSGSSNLEVVDLDVTDPASIAAAAERIAEAVEPAGLWGLVNNAGVNTGAGPLEFAELSGIRRQFEVNVIGQIAVTQAFMPLIRRGRGRIVLMGSAAGTALCPFTAPYCASKSALRALGAALRVELRPWGIPVAIVLPGAVATNIWSSSVQGIDDMLARLPAPAQGLYAESLAATRRHLQRLTRIGAPPEDVAAGVVSALTARRPKTRYLVGRFAQLTELTNRYWLNERLWEWFVARGMGLPSRAR